MIPAADIETHICLVKAIVTLSKHEQIQKALIEDRKLSLILDLIIFTYTQDTTSVDCFSESKLETKVLRRAQDPEDEAQLLALRSALSATLWEMTVLKEFTVNYSPVSDFVRRLTSWLLVDEPQMQLCACSILRNVASSDQNAIDMVMILKVHWLLRSHLDSSSNLQVLEESIRLLKNLAVPAANKKEIQNFESITSLWSKFESPTLQYGAASLVRQLLRGCFDNVQVFLRPKTSAENESDASRLFHLYDNTRDLAIKTEIARTIVEMWRTANSGDSEESRSRTSLVEAAVHQVNLRPDEVIKPVLAMMVESENPSLVTEGWFGLVLMADSEEWVEAIYNALCGDVIKNVFKAAVYSQDAHSKNQDNARILADRLLKHNVSIISSQSRLHNQTR